MSDIRNPLNGRIFHQVDNTLAEILVDAGIMEYARIATQVSAAPPPKENTFTIGTAGFGKLCITLTTPIGQVSRYECPDFASDLHPAAIRDAFKTMAWSGAAQAQILQGPEVPEKIVREFIEQAKHEARVNGAANAKIQAANDQNHGS